MIFGQNRAQPKPDQCSAEDTDERNRANRQCVHDRSSTPEANQHLNSFGDFHEWNTAVRPILFASNAMVPSIVPQARILAERSHLSVAGSKSAYREGARNIQRLRTGLHNFTGMTYGLPFTSKESPLQLGALDAAGGIDLSA
jgi:hypothetical protein